MNHLTLVIVGLLSLPAHAADRCGGVQLEGGSIRLGKPVTEDWVKTPEGQGCLADLVKEIDRFERKIGVFGFHSSSLMFTVDHDPVPSTEVVSIDFCFAITIA